MKKILLLVLGFVVFGSGVAFAQNINSTGTNPEVSPIATTTSMPPIMNTGIACVKDAVVARETAIGTSFSTFSASMSTALSTRATALANAWSLSDGSARRTARNTAWTEYKKASQNAKSIFKANKKATWKAFNEASKACKTTVVEYEANDNLSI